MSGASYSARKVPGETQLLLGCLGQAAILELYSYSVSSRIPSTSGQVRYRPLAPLSSKESPGDGGGSGGG